MGWSWGGWVQKGVNFPLSFHYNSNCVIRFNKKKNESDFPWAKFISKLVREVVVRGRWEGEGRSEVVPSVSNRKAPGKSFVKFELGKSLEVHKVTMKNSYVSPFSLH